MPRNTTTAPALALFVSPATGTQTLSQLHRVQSINYGVNIPKENILQYGVTAPISREALTPPEVNLDFSYYITGIDNESAVGLYMLGTQNILKYILDGTQNEKNYYVFVAPDGSDASGLTGADGKVKGFGNGFIGSVSVEGAVGSLPTTTVNVLASNIVGYPDGVAEQIPAVDPTTGIRLTGVNFTIPTISANVGASQPKIIRPGDITLTLSRATGLFHDISAACAQSFNLTVNLGREPINCLGSQFPRSRTVATPIETTLQLDLLSNDVISGDLSTFRCLTGLYNADITMRVPACTGTGAVSIGYTIRNMDLTSQNWSTQFGVLGETLTLNYSSFIGSTGDTTNGVFASGVSYSG